LAAGCGAGLTAVPPALAPPQAAVVVPEPELHPIEDPITTLLAASQQHFAAGEADLRIGHLEGARNEFNLAVEVLLAAPGGARSDERVRDYFGQLIDRISTYELSALAKGDGFSEKKYEPASIDDLLALSTFSQPAPAAGLEATVQTDLRKTSHDIPIPLNAQVLGYIQLFQTRLHDYLEEGMRRGGRYLAMIQGVFRAEGLPLDLGYVPLIESAFNPNALSRAKAKGLWQFMRGTALENGLKSDWYIDERSDPEKATVAAAAYLKTLRDQFAGDWYLALASYNAGPGRVLTALARARTDDFWSIPRTKRYLPRETREYVPMILAAIIIARNPAQYGFTFEPQALAAYEEVNLPGPVDLRRMAEWIGVSVDEIQTLNPELRRWTTPVRYPDYPVKVPVGTGDVLRARLEEATEGEWSALQWHTVKRGESLATIARKLGVRQADLAEANYLSARAVVTSGQQLIIPRAPSQLLAARTNAAPAAVVASQHTVAAQDSAQSADAVRASRSRITYRVKPGDTLSAIARLFNTNVESLKTWNTTIRGTQIRPGDRLTIFAAPSSN
jgi:membrane-bound lytic murein transglycosylase D